MFGPCFPKGPVPRARNCPPPLPSRLYPAAVATTNLKLTHKVLESQSAGEGDAREFILRIFSLTPLFSVPSVDEAAAGIFVLRSTYPSCPALGRGKVG